MLHGSNVSVLIQKHSGASHCTQRLSPGALLREIRGHILQTDGSDSFICKTIQHIVSIFVFGPDSQLFPYCIILVNPSVSVLVVLCQIRKTLSSSVRWYL